MGKEVCDKNKVRDIIETIAAAGVEKLNFAGGEPLMYPLFEYAVKNAKELGMVVSVVTNASLITQSKLDRISPYLDWIGISVDSASERIEAALGRGYGHHVAHALNVADWINEYQISLKVNTTVTKLNFAEDMKPLISRMAPRRWKVFQVLGIHGQNDEHFDQLSISDEEFRVFERNNQIDSCNVVFEGGDKMLDSYLMLSPSGDIMNNRNKQLEFMPLSKLKDSNINDILNMNKYYNRGGVYDWSSTA
jgi:radical S-adenosyl methionine domain-containing protein 2